MTKKEIELVHAFTELETAFAKFDYYEDQTDNYNDIEDAIENLKKMFYNVLLIEED